MRLRTEQACPIWKAVLLLAWAATGAFAQEGAGGIRGVITDQEFGGVVPAATVRLAETGVDRKTGDDGLFSFEGVAPGAYTLIVSKEGYARRMRSGVIVVPGRFAEVSIPLEGVYTEMEEFIVQDLDLGDTATETGLLTLRQSTLTFQDSVGKDLMQRAGASDAAGALKLVVGATVVDGKYASVRGLSDRYVGTSLNGQRVPSSDPKKRAVHMDLFPAGTIKNLSVYKTYTPDLPGDYSGGGVNIETIGIPDEPFFKASFSREYNTESTGQDDWVTYRGGGMDRWGRHKGARDMPDGAANMEEDGLTEKGLSSAHDRLESPEFPHSEKTKRYDAAARSFAPAMGTTRDRSGPNHGYSLSGGDRLEFGDDGWAFGWMGAFTYSDKYSVERIDETSLTLPNLDSPTDTNKTSFSRDTGAEEIKWSQMASVGLGNGDGHDANVSYLRNRVATDRASVRIGEHNAQSNSPWSQQQSIHYTERSLDLLQFRGEHKSPEALGRRTGLELSWHASHNKTEQEEPDVRNFRNVVVPRGNGLYEFQQRADGESGADEDSSTRIWRNTREDNTQYGYTLGLPFRWNVPDWHATWFGGEKGAWAEKEGRFRVGSNWDQTRRDYRQNSFYYTFAQQAEPLYTGPSRQDFPKGIQGTRAYQSAQSNWNVGAEGLAYQQAKVDAEADRKIKSYLSDDPDALWTDRFTDGDRLGAGPYQDSMHWYTLPKYRDVSYTGEQDFRSGFLMLDLPVSSQLNVFYGNRIEGTRMTVDPRSDLEQDDPQRAFIVPVRNYVTNSQGGTTYYYTLNGVPQEEAVAEIDQSDWLPSAGLTYRVVEDANLRFNWGRTIARPTFLELAPVITYDYIDNESFIGNKDLQLSDVQNVDIRGEWFFKPGDVVAVSWFRKDIDNPIERESFGYLGNDYLLAVNYPEGYVKGLEFEVRKKLDFLPGCADGLGVGANYTRLSSSVTLPDAMRDSLAYHGIDMKSRDMAGQPDYLFNVNLTWDEEHLGTSAGLFYNIVGDTLKSGASVGDKGATPDIYVKDFRMLNFSLSQKIGRRWQVTFAVKNLLQEEIREVYRDQENDEVYRRRYEVGRTYTFGVNCSF